MYRLTGRPRRKQCTPCGKIDEIHGVWIGNLPLPPLLYRHTAPSAFLQCGRGTRLPIRNAFPLTLLSGCCCCCCYAGWGHRGEFEGRRSLSRKTARCVCMGRVCASVCAEPAAAFGQTFKNGARAFFSWPEMKSKLSWFCFCFLWKLFIRGRWWMNSDENSFSIETYHDLERGKGWKFFLYDVFQKLRSWLNYLWYCEIPIEAAR